VIRLTWRGTSVSLLFSTRLTRLNERFYTLSQSVQDCQLLPKGKGGTLPSPRRFSSQDF
jgi:hypothetical protein